MIRQPLVAIYTKANNLTSSTNVVDTITLGRYDMDSLTVKYFATTVQGTAPGMNVYLQTTDDGGTTWYDMVSLFKVTATVTAAAAQWAPIQINKAPSTITASASDATLGAGTFSGVPLLSNQIRIKWVASAVISQYNDSLTIYVNNQSPHA